MQKTNQQIKDRQRKTKDPCQICFLHKDRCICDLIPKLTLSTRVCLVVHYKELKRTSNTGRLAITALSNSEMRVRGLIDETTDLSDLVAGEPSSHYQSLMLYPSDEASELTPELLSKYQKPIQLIIPDGNWRQASKVHYRHAELANVPRVCLKKEDSKEKNIRLETVENGMATLEAIAQALGVIEGEDVRAALLKLYKAKRDQTLLARGQAL